MEKIEPVETPNEKTFEKLRELQLLLKKESAMKELCKPKFNIKKLKLNSYKNKRRNKKSN